MTRTKFSKNSIYSQVFSFDILNYFDSIATKENYNWIKKYFDVLMKNENNSAEKFNIHHIRPCCTFKNNEHKNRKQTQKLGDEFNGNVIKLSVYNHLFAHYYLWKIFNNKDLKEAFQMMCGQGKYIDTLSENKLKNIARLKEECAKKNQTEEEKLEYHKNYRENNKEKRKEYAKIYHENNKEKESKYHKELYKNNKENFSKKRKEQYKNNREKELKLQKEWYKNNKDRKSKRQKEWNINNRDKINQKHKEYKSQLCFDPIKEDYPNYGALKQRIERHRELYKNIKPSQCIIKENQC